MSEAETKPAVAAEPGLLRRVGRAAWRARRPIVIVAAVAVLAAGAVLGVMKLLEPRPPSGLLASLDLPKKNNCGKDLVQFKRPPRSDDIWVFPLDSTWHHTRPCLDNLRVAAESQPADAPIHDFIYNQVLFILSQKPVRFYSNGGDGKQLFLGDVIDSNRKIDFGKFDRIVYVNHFDVAHNSMSHVDLMIFMFMAATTYLSAPEPQPERAAIYEALGRAVINVVLDPVEERGLRTRTACELRDGANCSWFHAVTNRYRPASNVGGTLNKDLQVIRDLYRGMLVLEKLQAMSPTPVREAEIAEMRSATTEGINQLVYSAGIKGGAPVPNLFEYIAVDPEGKPIENSWLFYAINVQKKRGYFLQREYWKNCSYHIKDMLHLFYILKDSGHLADTSGFREPSDYLGGKSLLDFIVDSYTDKVDGPDGLYKDSPTRPNGNYLACQEGYKDPAPKNVVQYLRDY